MEMTWTPERVEILNRLFEEGLPTSEIGRRMGRAVRLAGQRLTAAEVEVRIVRVAVRPQAARSAEFEEIALRHEFWPGLASAHSVAV